MLNPEIQSESPNLAKEIEQLQRFERNYDFSRMADQATFYEGMQQLARFCAQHSRQGRISIGVGGTGIVSVEASVTPSG